MLFGSWFDDWFWYFIVTAAMVRDIGSAAWL
jgi:hypothetical protein